MSKQETMERLHDFFRVYNNDFDFYEKCVKSYAKKNPLHVVEKDLKQDLIKRIEKEWKANQKNWFIAYLNETVKLSKSVQNNLKTLEDILGLLQQYDLEIDINTLEEILPLCPSFAAVLSSFFIPNVKVDLKFIENISSNSAITNLLCAYATIENLLSYNEQEIMKEFDKELD
ncbi:MAG: hypothetical protein K2M17_03425 [Bacilli bacterium]|nr:hypothetical protein [Bacilli bacterium]